jgi:large subunit ribosomal protein L5
MAKEKKPAQEGGEAKPEKEPKAGGAETPAEGGAGEKPAKAARPPKPPKAEGGAPAEKAEGAPAGEKAEKAEKPAKAEKAEKGEKGEKPPKGERSEKPGKPGEKPGKGKKGKEEGPADGEAAAEGEKKEKAPAAPPPPARLLVRYRQEIRGRLRQQHGYKNDMAVPRLDKIVVSMGVGAALQNPKRLEEAQKHLTQIAGQRAVLTKAKGSIAGFRLRQGNAIGCKVTLRRQRMYEFLDRLVSVAIPRIRDFRGLSPKAFDGRGNYSMGLTEQTVFPEVDADKMEFVQGMNIAICTTARTDKEALELLNQFGFPFRQA